MSTNYAQPYGVSARGFFFESAVEWAELSAKACNRSGSPVEELEIQFIDGASIDAARAEALDVHQGKIAYFFDREAKWDEHQRRVASIAMGECDFCLDLECCDADSFDVDIYELDTMRELAEEFLEEGLFGEISEHLANYIDYDAIARDLAMGYGQTCIAGTRLIYRCA